jgi:hypothetical protein
VARAVENFGLTPDRKASNARGCRALHRAPPNLIRRGVMFLKPFDEFECFLRRLDTMSHTSERSLGCTVEQLSASDDQFHTGAAMIMKPSS